MAVEYYSKHVRLSFDEFFLHACKCGTIVKFVKTTSVERSLINAIRNPATQQILLQLSKQQVEPGAVH